MGKLSIKIVEEKDNTVIGLLEVIMVKVDTEKVKNGEEVVAEKMTMIQD